MRLRLAVVAAILVSSLAVAQEAKYPTQPINMIVPFSPGGSSDILARIIEPVLAKHLGQPIVILNRPGASGAIGMELLSKAAPDGHTILVGNSLQFIRIYLEMKDLKFSSADFIPVSLIGETPLSLVVNPDLPVKKLKELIEYARANPNKISYGAIGATLDIAMILNDQKIAMQPVPYPGGSGQLMKDIVGGHIQFIAATTSSVVSYIKGGQLRAVALMSDKRDPELPDVPTVVESGYPQFQSSLIFGIMAPAKTPRPIIDKLHQAIVQTVADEQIKKQFLTSVVQPKSNASPEDFQKYLDVEMARWRKISDGVEVKN